MSRISKNNLNRNDYLMSDDEWSRFLKGEEIWKDIDGYEGLYRAGSNGKIKSLSRFAKIKNNKLRHVKERIKKTSKNGAGYLALTLSKYGGEKKFQVHNIILKTFVKNPHGKKCCDHINAIKTDNRLTNLRWATYSENIKHAYKLGLNKITKKRKMTSRQNGIKHLSKKTLCIETKKNYYSCIEASRETGINRTSLWRALTGRQKKAGGFTWKYI